MSAQDRRRAPAGAGHNAGADLKTLEKQAKVQQIAAQQAWFALMNAQITHKEPWVKILESATRTGVAADVVRRKFNVSPSTFSRWQSGFASPSNPLRERLAVDLAELAKETSKTVE